MVVCTFSPYKAGMGNAAWEQARQLKKLGNEVTVFTPRYQKEQKKFEEMRGVKVRRLTPVFKYGNGAFLLQVFGRLKDFDTVFLHYPFFGTAEVVWIWKLFNPKKRLVIQYHMDVFGKGLLGIFFRIYAKILMPWILRAGDKVIVSSFDYARSSDARGLVDDRWVEIPFGIDLERFPSNRLESGSNVSNKFKRDGEKVVLFVGGLDKAHYFKGVDVLIEAMRDVRCEMLDARCVIVGGGDMLEEYQRMAREKGLEDVIEFPGKVSDGELVDFYERASVLVLPSVDRCEAFGIVLIEAMSHSVPVIASDLAGVRSVVSDGENGFLVKPRDIKGLTEKIEWVLSHPDEAREMGLAGRRRVEERYDWEKIGRKLLLVISK